MSYRASVIKSLQYSSITFGDADATKTATLSTTVTAANAYVQWLGTIGTSGDARTFDTKLVLTNATTVTATRNLAGAGTGVITTFVVVELFPFAFHSIQDFDVALVAASSGTATLSPAVLGKGQVIFRGQAMATYSSAALEIMLGQLTLTNATTVTATRNNGTNTLTVSGTVVDWK